MKALSTLSKNNQAWVKAVREGNAKKARRALIRLTGIVNRHLVKEMKAGRHEMKAPVFKTLSNARMFDRAAMDKVHEQNGWGKYA